MTERLPRRILMAVLAVTPLLIVAILVFTLSGSRADIVQANGTPANPSAFHFAFSLTNNTGQQATDLHVTFSSPVDKPTVTAQPSACDDTDPDGPEVSQPSDTEVVAVWSIKCIDPVAGAGGKVTVRGYSKDPVLRIVSVIWTNFDTPIPTLTPTSAVTPTPSPSATPTPVPCVPVWRVARALFTSPGDRRWDPGADLDGSNSVDLRDLSIAVGQLLGDPCG